MTGRVRPTCVRCGRPIVDPRAMCPKRVPYTFSCWPAKDSGATLQIDSDLAIRPGSHPAAQLLDLGADPYAEDK